MAVRRTMKNKYNNEELEKALSMVEDGYSFADVCEGTSLNKSIIAREMRKRGNEKAQRNIDESNKKTYEEFLVMYEFYKK